MASEKSLEENIEKWNELNLKVQASMGQFDFDTIKVIRKEQTELEDSVYEILMKNAPDEIKKILPEECGSLEVGVEMRKKRFYFVMEDPAYADSDEIKLIAITIDAKNNIELVKDFEID